MRANHVRVGEAGCLAGSWVREGGMWRECRGCEMKVEA